MPKGTKVEQIYEALRDKGYSKAKSARIAQNRTGASLATGKPPKPQGQTAASTLAGQG